MSFIYNEHLLLWIIFILLAFIIIFIFKVRELKLLKNQNYRQQQYYEAMQEANSVSKGDLYGNITYINDGLCKVSQYTREELLGKSHLILKGEEDDFIYKDIQKTLEKKEVWKGIFKSKNKNGEFYWTNTIVKPVLDEKGKFIEYIAIHHDITDLILKTEQLKVSLRKDYLTNVGNRVKLIEDIPNLENPCIAVLDIVNFSDVNDFFGYKNGDNVLKIVTQKINELLIGKDNYELYRDYSDIFCIVSQNETRDDFIKNIEDVAKIVFKTPILVRGKEIFVQLSYVFSFEPKDVLLETAYMIKKYANNNKNITVYDKCLDLEKEYEKNLFWSFKIKKAIEQDKIVPYFQAIYNLQTEKIEKYEALIRLIDENNVISPYYFLDISKKSKQYLQLTKIMIQKTFDYFKDKDFNFSINLTFEDIKSEYILSFIIEMLEKYQIGNRVIFELVENENIDNYRVMGEFIAIVKQFGCKISIDDFGSGYSNFEYLLKIDIDFIKIDGSLIKDVLINKGNQVIVSMLVDFAKGQDIKTIAEFVSNEEIFDKVRELGVDFVQGYYIKEPMNNVIETSAINWA